jgi:hypothetical protein
VDPAVDHDPAGIGRLGAGQDLEQGRLAGAVLAKEAVDLARDQVERDAVQRLDAGVSFREAGDLEERR